MAYPTDKETHSNVTANVTTIQAEHVNFGYGLTGRIQDYLGYEGDSASSSGNISEKMAYVLANLGGIVKDATEPGSPSTDDLWIDTDDTTRPLRIFYSAAYHLVGANALQLQGFTVHTTTPTNGQVLTYDLANTRWAPATPTGGFTDPMSVAGDLIVRNVSNVTDRLGIGSAGQFLGVSGGVATWQTPNFVPAPATPQQGDVLYYNGSTWARLGPGTTGQFLKTLGASTNPLWATPPSSAPGDGILDPGGETQGSILYYDGTDWQQLAPGTSGLFLKTNGVSANPAWAAPAAGFTNPMTTLSDIIIADTGGTALRLGIGSAGQFLKVVSGAPAWTGLGGGVVGTFLDFTEQGSAPSTPTSAGRFYVLTSDTKAYFKSSGGTAFPLFPMTTLDDIIIGGSSGLPTRLAKGSNGHVLTISGSGHVVWAASSSGFADPTTTRGDLIYHDASSTTRLALGAADTLLTSDGTDAAWVAPRWSKRLAFA